MSEKIERPLSQLRPASATEERENFKQTRRDLTRYFWLDFFGDFEIVIHYRLACRALDKEKWPDVMIITVATVHQMSYPLYF